MILYSYSERLAKNDRETIKVFRGGEYLWSNERKVNNKTPDYDEY